MQQTLTKEEYELSIWGVFEIIIVYMLIIAGLINIPFDELLKISYIKNHLIFSNLIATIGQAFSSFIPIMLLIRNIRKKSDFRLKYKENFSIKLLVCTIFIMVGYVLFYQNTIGVLTSKIQINSFVEEAFRGLSANSAAFIISVVIIAPISEEMIMRGIILEGLLHKYKPMTAIIISALFFGAMHMNIPQFVNAFFIGLISGIIYYKTSSLMLSIAAHMANNIFVLFDIPGGILFTFIGIVILLISSYAFKKYADEA